MKLLLKKIKNGDKESLETFVKEIEKRLYIIAMARLMNEADAKDATQETLIKIYNIIDKHIKQSYKEGKISEAQSEEVARWALIKIYKIQNNSKLLNAFKTYSVLN